MHERTPRRPCSRRSGSSTRSSPRARRRPGGALHRPAPDARGDLAPGLRACCASAGLPVRRPERTLATMDHSTPTRTAQVFGGAPIAIDSAARAGRRSSSSNCAEFGVELLALRHAQRGIVHVIGPELGLTPARADDRLRRQPHQHARRARRARLRHRHHRGRPRARHAVPAAAQAADASRSTSAARCAAGVTAKDLILAHHRRRSASTAAPATCIEYRGAAIRALDMEERMTVCNMSIEAGARAGMIAPGRDHLRVPRGPAARPAGRGLGAGARSAGAPCRAMPGARFDREVQLDAAARRADDHLRHQSRAW